MNTRNDPTNARVFTPAEATTYSTPDAGSPTMLRMPREMARVFRENLEAFATYHEGVAVKCATDHGRANEEAHALALRSYAAGLMEHAT